LVNVDIVRVVPVPTGVFSIPMTAFGSVTTSDVDSLGSEIEVIRLDGPANRTRPTIKRGTAALRSRDPSLPPARVGRLGRGRRLILLGGCTEA